MSTQQPEALRLAEIPSDYSSFTIVETQQAQAEPHTARHQRRQHGRHQQRVAAEDPDADLERQLGKVDGGDRPAEGVHLHCAGARAYRRPATNCSARP